MQWLKQSTGVTLKIGPFLDETDGKTAESGLTISQADVRLSKNGANIAQKTEATSCTHDELGIYGCPIDATDTDTLGRLQLWVHESGALPVWHEFMVVPANVWDSFFGSDKLEVDATQIEGSDATDQINAAVDAALNTAIPGSPTANSINERIAAIDDLTQASGAGDLAAILTDTNELQTDNVPGLIGALNDPTAAAVADAVWDEVLTGATHNVASSAGRRLRELGAFSVVSGTAAAGAAQTITLDTDASATANIYNENLIVIIGGTGAGQARMIVEYTTGRVATVDREWEVTPSTDSEYQVIAFSGILLAAHGVAQAGAASTITLATSALAVANSYVGCAIYIAAGTGVGQTRLITAYTTGRVATVSPAWDTQPDNTSIYKVLPVGRSIVESLPTATQASIDAIQAITDLLTLAAIADAVLDEPLADHDTEDTLGNVLNDLVEEPAGGVYRFTAAALSQGPTEAGAGSGGIEFTYTLTSSVNSAPIADAAVWVTTDQAGTNVVASQTTDVNGQVVFYLDAGTVYVWRQKSGWNFTNPDTETVA